MKNLIFLVLGLAFVFLLALKMNFAAIINFVLLIAFGLTKEDMK